MAVSVVAPSLSSKISYDFQYQKIDETILPHWFALQFWCEDSRDPFAGGYFGLQQTSWIGESAALFSQFGTGARNPIVGQGGRFLGTADGGAGISTAIPFAFEEGLSYHIEIELINHRLYSHITNVSTNVRTFVSSIEAPYLKGFSGAFLWDEYWMPLTDRTKGSNAQATFSNIKFDDNDAQFFGFEPRISMGSSEASLEDIKSVLLFNDRHYSIIVGPYNYGEIYFEDWGGTLILNEGRYNIFGSNETDYVKITSLFEDQIVSQTGSDITFQDIKNNSIITINDSVEYVIFQDKIYDRGELQEKSSIKNGFVNNDYLYVGGYHTWDNARVLASQYTKNGVSGHLVSVESDEEQNYLESILRNHSVSGAWISGSDQDTEGFWKFSDGPNSGLLVNHLNWSRNEPNGGRVENYIALWDVVDNRFGYVDVPSSNLFGFIVEFEDSKLFDSGNILFSSMASVNEGSVATFMLTTANVAAGTQVAYTLSGVSAADIQDGSLSGTTIVGSNGHSVIPVALLSDNLTEGSETLTITAAGKTASIIVNDTSRSLSANFAGTSGNDIFYLSSGSNSVDGGAGSDTVQYQSTRSSATVTYSNGIITVSKAGGTDRIVGVERVDFTDGDLIFDVVSASAPAAYRLYGGAFDRTPDEGGFRFWAQTLDKGVSLNDVAAYFIGSDEFVARYGNNLSNAAFVDALYLNVVNRPGEAGGVAFWNNMLNNNALDRADVLVEFTQLPEYVGISAADVANGYWVV